MTRLKQRMVRRIISDGPMPVSEFMSLCLLDPDDGYYTNRDPFGTTGDFITAPDISQMFGELVAAFIANAWNESGKPQRLTFAEAGPGRATLMHDMLRTLAHRADFMAAVDIHMVEASERLTAVQKDRLAPLGHPIRWTTGVDALPSQPVFLVANEFLDALPIRQFVKTPQGWRERMVSTDENGDLTWVSGTATLDEKDLPSDHGDKPDGTIFEIAPAREAVVDQIAQRIASDSGIAVFVDYGHVETGFGDTLQAVLNHRYDPVFDNPGKADLTSHVDFEALAVAARAAGAHVHPLMTQADFLLGLGLLERAGQLGTAKDRGTQDTIRAAVQRLAGNGPDDMGDLFKVMCIASDDRSLAPFPCKSV